MSLDHLYSLSEWDAQSFENLLTEARDFKLRQRRPSARARGKSACFVFLNPSLRTRVSLEMACHRLGIKSISLHPGADAWKWEWKTGIEMSGETQEHLQEAVSVLSRYCDILGIRSFSGGKDLQEDRLDPVVKGFIEYATVPVVNMESGLYHPLQALADLMTLREKLGRLNEKKIVLTWTCHPRAVPMAVTNSFLLALARTPCELVLTHPPQYDLLPEVLQEVWRFSRASGGSFEVSNNPVEALDGADAVYVKSWGSAALYGKPDEEKAVRDSHQDWKVTSERLERTQDALVMHCLPLRRNVEISEAVVKSPRCVIADQAENRLWTAMAVLNSLVKAA